MCIREERIQDRTISSEISAPGETVLGINDLVSRIASVNRTADRVLVVANPTAGAGAREQAVADLVACLRSHEFVVELVRNASEIESLARQLQAAGQLRAVVAAGGDGTVAEVVNRTAADVPITVFPLGTANLLARYLNIPADPRAVARLVSEGTACGSTRRANNRVFLLMAGCGFDADVVARLHRQRSGRHISYWTYARPILESIRNYGYPKLRITCASDAATQPASEVPHGPLGVRRQPAVLRRRNSTGSQGGWHRRCARRVHLLQRLAVSRAEVSRTCETGLAANAVGSLPCTGDARPHRI